MSTRSQVKVIDDEPEGNFSENVTLYHHHDGYPGHMVPLIHKAWKFGTKVHDKRYPNLELGKINRAGHVAAYLCYVHPLEFEPESGHELHGDIEWYYKVYVSNKTKSISIRKAGVGEWMVEIHVAKGDYGDGPTTTACVYKSPITEMITTKGTLKIDVARKIRSKTEDAYIGVDFAGKRL